MMKKLSTLTLTVFCCLLFMATAWSQKTITGKITGQSDGAALPGVSVVLKGTTNGTITDMDGNFTLSVPNNATTLTLSFVGFLTKEMDIGNASTVDIALVEDTKQLDAVVVTSFGIKREKKALSYSVTEVSGDDVLKANQPNFLSALQGKVPGALITNSSGAPGAGTSIILRGINSLAPGANNQPLIVIDGMLMSNETVVGNVLPSAGSNAVSGSNEQFSQTNRLADLNPNDIESVNVLKGAAASALYGSQGSNGVIVITTKKGQVGKPTISFNTNYSVEELTKSPDLQDLYVDGLSGYKRFAPATVYWQYGPLNTANDPLFNNQRDFFQQGSRADNALTISGGSDRFTYLSSLGYMNHQGVVPNTDFKRLTGRLRSTYKATNWLTLSGSVAYTKSGGLKPNGGDKSIFSALSFHAQSFDVNNYINPDGTEIDYSAGIIDNPRWLTEFSTFTDNVNRYSTQIAADAQLLPWLTMRYQVGSDAYTDFRKRFAPAASDVGAQIGGYITEENMASRLTTSDLLFTAQKEVNKDLTLRLLAGNQVIDNKFESGFVRGERLGVPNVINIKNGTTFFAGRSDARSRLIGVFADLNVEYKDFIFLTASARNDWVSTLPKENRSFFYPSVGLSFLFTEALGLSEGILSYGKIRTSYAESGKGTDPHQIGRLYDFTTPFGGVGQTRLSSSLSDVSLRPERTKEIEIGAELRFFKNRFGLDFTYFTRNSVDLIQPLPVSNTTGYARYLSNVGEIRNRGVELAVNTTPIKAKDFRWDVNFTFTQFSGDVVRISDSIQQFDLFDASPTSTPITYRYKTGGKVGDLYGFQFRKHSSGAMLIGANGFPTVNTTQYVLVGNAIPDFIAAATTQLTFKGVSVSGLFEWRKGGDMVDLSQRNSIRNGLLENTERRYEQMIFNGVLADGSKNTIPVEVNEVTLYRDFNRYNSASELLIQDGSWLRLRNISVAYAVPNSLMKKLPFSGLTIRLTGNNLWLNTPYRGYDPEGNQFGAGSNIFGFTGFVTPPLRSYAIGLNVNFK
jgi:TonB-linked SusC/RagA family outer membrane protein